MQNALLPVHQEESSAASPANNAVLTGADLAQLRRSKTTESPITPGPWTTLRGRVFKNVPKPWSPLAAAKEDKDQTGQEGQAIGHEAAQAESRHHPRGTSPAPASLQTSREQSPTPQGATQSSCKGRPPTSKGPGPLPDLPKPRHTGPDPVQGLHPETPATPNSG